MEQNNTVNPKQCERKKKSLSLCFSFEVIRIPSDHTFVKNCVLLELMKLLMRKCKTPSAFAKQQAHFS